jgi:hypothetical protein
MSYTLRFSDPLKNSTVTVPDMPPGINTVDTSLSLVGKGYPNYGEKIADNFLHLLENFASPIPPENPIEGQLWYDTSDTSKKVLRVMDGTATASRWPSANGIYQQGTDPKNSSGASLKNGDIWVDTSVNQLKIYNSNIWTTVGPSVGSGGNKTGVEASKLFSNDNPASEYPVIFNYINGIVVSIVTNNAFTPNPVISGFSTLQPGINFYNNVDTGNYAILNGIASSAQSLQVSNSPYSGNEFLRKNDKSSGGQLIKGRVIYRQPSSVASEVKGTYGILIDVDGGPITEYVQLYKDGSDAVLLNNKSSGKISLRINNYGLSFDGLTVENSLVTINTATSIDGEVTIKRALTVNSNAHITGTTTIDGNNYVTGGALIGGVTTATGKIIVGSSGGSGVALVSNNNNSYDIGTATNYFRSMYVSTIYSSNIYTSNVFATNVAWTTGTLQLSATDTIPAGWLKCNGSTATTSTYVGLYSVIGNKYGTAPGNNGFYLPNLYTTSTTAGGTTTTYYIIKT